MIEGPKGCSNVEDMTSIAREIILSGS